MRSTSAPDWLQRQDAQPREVHFCSNLRFSSKRAPHPFTGTHSSLPSIGESSPCFPVSHEGRASSLHIPSHRMGELPSSADIENKCIKLMLDL